MMDDIDRKILDEIQTDFPLASRPFEVLANRLGLSEEEIQKRIRTLRESGIIRRIGASFNSRKLGHTSTLCAMKIPEESLEAVAEVVKQYEGVTHCYGRDDEYNLWFTLISRSKEEIASILSEIKAKTGIDEILDLPAKSLFKIEAVF